MSARKLKVAVVGFGSIGRHHARNLNAMPGVELCAVVDTSEAARADAAGLHYRTMATTGELIRAGADGAVIAVPTSEHYAVALDLLAAGIPLLVEKPIAPSIEQGAEIIDIAERRGLPLMVGYVERFNPAVIAAHRLMRDGLVGTPLHLATRRVGGMPIRITDANVIVDIGVHDLDVISFLLESELRLISAQGGMALIGDRVDYASLALDGAGVVAHATVNWVTPVKVRDLIITGSNGYLQVDYLRQSTHFAPGRDFHVTESYEAVVAQYEQGTLIDMPIDRQEPLRLELERFAAVLRGETPAPDARVSLTSLRIALEATALIERSLRVEAVR
ncbi:MAG TPA: Gfo/Idh/MocA family oxidoreductase [Candidatus Elarobacter sp.]